MAETAEDAVIRNLMQALGQLQEDLDRVEVWSSALDYFHRPIPEYHPSDSHLLPHRDSSVIGR